MYKIVFLESLRMGMRLEVLLVKRLAGITRRGYIRNLRKYKRCGKPEFFDFEGVFAGCRFIQGGAQESWQKIVCLCPVYKGFRQPGAGILPERTEGVGFPTTMH